jgi:hypothetical protein
MHAPGSEAYPMCEGIEVMNPLSAALLMAQQSQPHPGGHNVG